VSALHIADAARHGDPALVIQVDVLVAIVELRLGEISLKSKPMVRSQTTRSLSKAAPLFSSSVFTEELNRGRGISGLPLLGCHGHFDDFIRCEGRRGDRKAQWLNARIARSLVSPARKPCGSFETEKS
jgi:hypothetical protein